MAITDKVKMWIKDRLAQDEQITITPIAAMRNVSAVAEKLSALERTQNLEHVQAYASVYYQGRHNMQIPPEFKRDLTGLELRVTRLNEVDAAREIVQKYGGPPTHETILESLSRSQKSREITRQPVVSVGIQQESSAVSSGAIPVIRGHSQEREKQISQDYGVGM